MPFMIVLAVTLHVKAGKEDAVIEHFRTLEPESRKEAGCLVYIVHRGTSNPREFLVYEQYVDEAALEAHRQTPHFLEHAPKVYECCEAQQRALYRPLNESTRELLAD
ncbi:MAG TPA: putative quinol monooxygenase [Terriglobales bacterium]|jgi:quinol monooxygenase YgiN